MLIKNKVWRSLSQKEKFELLLLHANLNVVGKQVIQRVKQWQKNKSYQPNKWRRTHQRR